LQLLNAAGVATSTWTNDAGINFYTPTLSVGESTLPSGGVATFSGNVGIRTTVPTELLTLGTAGTTAGVLSLAGATSGKATIVVPSVAGTPTITLPTVSGTVALTSDIPIKRVVTTTDNATATIDVTATDVYELTAIANNTTFSTTGTPTDGQHLMIRFKDAGVAKSLTWTGFTAIGVTLPTTTVAGKWHYVGCVYNAAASTWHVLAVGQQS
jgi:hypothetical protein